MLVMLAQLAAALPAISQVHSVFSPIVSRLLTVWQSGGVCWTLEEAITAVRLSFWANKRDKTSSSCCTGSIWYSSLNRGGNLEMRPHISSFQQKRLRHFPSSVLPSFQCPGRKGRQVEAA